MNRCKHGLIQSQCGDCKDLPPYQEQPPHNPVTNKYKEEEKPVVEEKIFIDSEGNANRVCIRCGGKHVARGLCSKCYSDWHQGKIEHPELGEFVKTEKGQKMVEAKNKKQKKFSIEPQDGFEVDRTKGDPCLKELRSRLKDAKILCQAITMTTATGHDDKIKREIQFFLKDWI